MGLKPPSMVPLTLAVATDALLKNEFDQIRGTNKSHPLWELHGLPVRAFSHQDLDLWRSNFKGIRITYSAGIEVFGAVDDIWQNVESGELYVVDYKSTSKKDAPSLDGGFGDSYKRQMEVYQWLLRAVGFKVSDTGFFLYVNGRKDRTFYRTGTTEGQLVFDTTLLSHVGSDSWVPSAVERAVSLLQSEEVPIGSSTCDSCRYFSDRLKLSEERL